MKAFLGMGLLGANFVRNMLGKGGQVQVWNRTAEKAFALEQYGAKAFNHVAEAVQGANIIHIVVKDDAAVDEVLENASAGFVPGAVIIDHTTTSKEGAIQRTEDWKKRGYTYLHAPVFMGPQNALEGTGYMLVSGDQDVVTRFEPELTPMTGKLINFGPETGKAAALKLLGNSFLVCFTAGIADMLSLAKALQTPASDIQTLFEHWNPGASLPARLRRLANGNYDTPSWELSMARKDTGIFIASALAAGVPLAVIPAIAAEMDRFIAKGYGSKDWAVIAKDAVS